MKWLLCTLLASLLTTNLTFAGERIDDGASSSSSSESSSSSSDDDTYYRGYDRCETGSGCAPTNPAPTKPTSSDRCETGYGCSSTTAPQPTPPKKQMRYLCDVKNPQYCIWVYN